MKSTKDKNLTLRRVQRVRSLSWRLVRDPFDADPHAWTLQGWFSDKTVTNWVDVACAVGTHKLHIVAAEERGKRKVQFGVGKASKVAVSETIFPRCQQCGIKHRNGCHLLHSQTLAIAASKRHVSLVEDSHFFFTNEPALWTKRAWARENGRIHHCLVGCHGDRCLLL